LDPAEMFLELWTPLNDDLKIFLQGLVYLILEILYDLKLQTRSRALRFSDVH
jgi:hypothetical protein